MSSSSMASQRRMAPPSSSSSSAAGLTCPPPLQTLDGAHNARLGFQFMQEAQKNPDMMADVMKVGLPSLACQSTHHPVGGWGRGDWQSPLLVALIATRFTDIPTETIINTSMPTPCFSRCLPWNLIIFSVWCGVAWHEQDMQDPDTMAEVQKMMQDPSFRETPHQPLSCAPLSLSPPSHHYLRI